MTVVEELALFRLGGIQPFVVFVHGFIARLFDVSVQPTTWEWTTILVSSVSAPLAFLAGKRFGGGSVGWVWGIFCAVSPIHVMLGRSLAAPWAYELVFQMSLLWSVERYLGDVRRGFAWVPFTCLALYMWCGNQMMAFFPVVTYALLAHTVEQPKEQRLEFLRSKLLSWWLLLPLASGLVLTYCTFVLREGHLHHALFEKRKTLGWYGSNVYSDLVRNIGYVPAWACLCALACALIAPLPLLHRKRIPLVYTLCYLLPFVFLIHRGTTLTRGYSVYGLTGLLGLVAMAPIYVDPIVARLGSTRKLLNFRWVTPVAYGVLAAFLVAGTGAAAHRLYSGRLLGVKGFQGSNNKQTGVAAAAAFVTRHAREEHTLKGRVFSDAYGGMGLEPPIMRLYFKRRYFAKYDASRMQPWKAFAANAAQIDFAVIRPENAKFVPKYFPELRLAAKVKRDDEKTPLLLVYARGFRDKARVLRAEDGPDAYARAFDSFCPG